MTVYLFLFLGASAALLESQQQRQRISKLLFFSYSTVGNIGKFPPEMFFFPPLIGQSAQPDQSEDVKENNGGGATAKAQL